MHATRPRGRGGHPAHGRGPGGLRLPGAGGPARRGTGRRVYAFPDRTEATGKAAAWRKELRLPEFLAFGGRGWEPVGAGEAREWLGDVAWLPGMLPDRFRYRGAWIPGSRLKRVMADPHRRELFVVHVGTIGHTGARYAGTFGRPLGFACSDRDPADGEP